MRIEEPFSVGFVSPATHNPLFRRLHPWIRPGLIGVAAMLVPACATVDPRSDYARSRALVTEATGAEEIYDPAAEQESDEQIRAMLEDGLSIDEAERIALLNNRGLRTAFLEIGASRADVVQSGLLSNPSLGLSLRFPEGGGRSNLTAGLGQQIVDLWQIPVRKRLAEAELEQIILAAAERAVRLSAEVKQAYYQLIAAKKAETLTRENLELVQRSVELAQARFDAGEVGQIDVNLVRANLISVQLAAMTVKREREQATNQLGRLLGLSRSHPPLELSDTWPEIVPLTLDEDQALLAALEHRLDARVAALRVKAADAELEKECRSVFPNITLGLEAERPERRALPGRTILADTARASIGSGGLTAPGIQSRSERRRERSQIIDLLLGPTLDVTLPIWDQNQAQIAKAKYKTRQMRAAYEDLLDGVALEVANALSVMRSAQELVQFHETEALPQARQSVEAARATYEAGEQGILVLIDAQETLIGQQRSEVIALRDFAQARAELERAVGIPISQCLGLGADGSEEGNQSSKDEP